MSYRSLSAGAVILKISYVRSPTVRSALALNVSGCSVCVDSVLMDPFCREVTQPAQTGRRRDPGGARERLGSDPRATRERPGATRERLGSDSGATRRAATGP